MYLDIDDPTGSIEALHAQLSALESPAWARAGFRPHVTLVHGRTVDPDQAEPAWAALCDVTFGWTVQLSALDVIELDEATGWRSVLRLPLGAAPYSHVVAGAHYHIGFGVEHIPTGTSIVLLSGDPARSELIATKHLRDGVLLARSRGLDAFHARLPSGAPVLCATSGMGAPTMSIVVNELVQIGVRTIIRIGTSGSIRDEVRAGSVVIASGALTNQGAADDIAPPQFPAVADPFLTVTLAGVADERGIERHVGVVASTDTFFEGQERVGLLRQPTPAAAGPRHDRRVPRTRRAELRDGSRHVVQDGLRLRLRRGCVLAIIAERTEAEHIHHHVKDAAVERAIAVAIAGADAWSRASRTDVVALTETDQRGGASGGTAVVGVDGDRAWARRVLEHVVVWLPLSDCTSTW